MPTQTREVINFFHILSLTTFLPNSDLQYLKKPDLKQLGWYLNCRERFFKYISVEQKKLQL